MFKLSEVCIIYVYAWLGVKQTDVAPNDIEQSVVGTEVISRYVFASCCDKFRDKVQKYSERERE